MIKCAKGWKNSLGSLLDYSRIKMNICHLKQSRSLRFNKEHFLLRSHKWLHRELPVVVPDWLGSCVVHVIIRHPQSRVSWNLWSPLDEHLIDVYLDWWTLDRHLNQYSVNILVNSRPRVDWFSQTRHRLSNSCKWVDPHSTNY